MATRTLQVASFYNGTILYQADYNDANNRVTALRIINTTATRTATGVATRNATSFTLTATPGQTSETSVPAGAITLAFDGSGEITSAWSGQYQVT